MHYAVYSWGVVAFLTAGLYCFYNPATIKNILAKLNKQQTTPQRINGVESKAAKKQKTKRPGISTPTSLTEGNTSKKRKITSDPVGEKASLSASTAQSTAVSQRGDDSMSNAEFARQLAGVKAGNKLNFAKKSSLGSPDISTATSSTTDADGEDDEQSGSPLATSVSTAATSRAGDISDMLETEPEKPWIMNITKPNKSIAASKSQPARRETEKEITQKQKARKRKAEARAEEVKRSNAQHEAKKQQQMRTARMAEGTSAQIKSNAFRAPPPTAWSVNGALAPETVAKPPTTNGTTQLLDTMESENAILPAPAEGAVSARQLTDITNHKPAGPNVSTVKAEQGDDRTNALGASSRERLIQAAPSFGGWADEMNDEELNRFAQEQKKEQSWDTVKSRKGKKKGGKMDDTSSEASSGFTRPNGDTTRRIANGFRERPENLNRFQSFGEVTL